MSVIQLQREITRQLGSRDPLLVDRGDHSLILLVAVAQVPVSKYGKYLKLFGIPVYFTVWIALKSESKWKYKLPYSKDHPLGHDRVIGVNGGAVEEEWNAIDFTDLIWQQIE